MGGEGSGKGQGRGKAEGAKVTRLVTFSRWTGFHWRKETGRRHDVSTPKGQTPEHSAVARGLVLTSTVVCNLEGLLSQEHG